MGKLILYVKLCFLFTIALVVPTSTLGNKVEKLLAEVRGDWAPPSKT